jgi:hypothetical protein
MPGSVTHLIIQQRLEAALAQQGGSGAQLANLLAADRTSKFTAFGSIGPDFLFFSLREYGHHLQDYFNFVIDVYDALEPFIEFYDENIKPIKTAIDDFGNQIDQTFFKGLVGNTKVTADLISTTLRTLVEAIVTQQVDFFDAFKPKIQSGAPENQWYWFDLLHYRRTGRFCSTMLQMAGNDADLRRYCIGYASHIAADVVGHPFVNGIVGGPYRMHWHRHKVVENWIDAYARARYPDSNLILNSLPPDEENLPGEIAGSHYADLISFPSRRLPRKLSNLFAAAMRATYGGPPGSPALMTPADLDSTYRLFLLWFDRATSLGTAKPMPMSPPPGGAASTLINDYLNGFPPPPGAGTTPSGNISIGGIFAALFAFVSYLTDVIVYTADYLADHIADIALLPINEFLNTLNWLLDQIQSAVYQIYDNYRFILVLGGYVFPEQGDLAKVPWGRALINFTFAHETGGGKASLSKYPRRRVPRPLFSAQNEFWLRYPQTPLENPTTLPHCEPWSVQFPEAFIDSSGLPTVASQDLLTCIGPFGTGTQFTHPVDLATSGTTQLGDGINFSAWLIAHHLTNLPDFNLDGDRGYGWKTWRPTDRHIDTNDPIVNDDYNI